MHDQLKMNCKTSKVLNAYTTMNMFVKSLDKEMFLFIYAASGPLHYSLHLHRALCNNAGLWGLTTKCFGGN